MKKFRLLVQRVPRPLCGRGDVVRQQGCYPFRGCLPWLLLLLLLCPNPAAAVVTNTDYGRGIPERFETLVRPDNAGPFGSGTQLSQIRSYCAGMNISDYVCRRIGRIFFAAKNHEEEAGGTLWENNHQTAEGAPDWGDQRMVASVDTGGTSYSCMTIQFDPPLETDWGVSFHWTVGQEYNGLDRLGSADRLTAVNVLYVASNQTDSLTRRDNYIGYDLLSAAFRSTRFSGGFLEWQKSTISRLGARGAETRWCFFGASARSGYYSRIRLDGVSFGRPRQTFCRPELNPAAGFCRPGHNDFIDRYCAALNLTTANCQQVSRLVFTRSGVGEHVWDPTHDAGSQSGSAPSVLSPVVRAGDYSCMSLLLDPPHPVGVPIRFDWTVGRRARYSSERRNRQEEAFIRFYYFAPGSGADHAPIGSDGQVASSKGFRIAGIDAGGYAVWAAQSSDIAEPAGVGELKWCYFGGNGVAGNGDRGRFDRLRIVTRLSPQDYGNGMPERMETLERPGGSGLFSSTTQSRSIRDYCDGLNISDYNCRRISRINFFADALPSGVPVLWDNNHRSVLFGDSEPPYDQGLGDPRMVASPGICSPGNSPGVCADVTADHSSYSCMALVFDPPIPMGWNIEYRWTVGARQPARDSQVRGTAVDIRFRADTGSNSDIQLADRQGRLRENIATDGFTPHGNTDTSGTLEARSPKSGGAFSPAIFARASAIWRVSTAFCSVPMMARNSAVPS